MDLCHKTEKNEIKVRMKKTGKSYIRRSVYNHIKTKMVGKIVIVAPGITDDKSCVH